MAENNIRKSIIVNTFNIGFVNGLLQLFLFDGADENEEQQCALHTACGKSLCIGELVLIEQVEKESEQAFLKGYRIRQGMKSCCVGRIPIIKEHYDVFHAFDQVLTQVDFLSDAEARMSSVVNGSIKLIVVGIKSGPQFT